jgi:hypothetical protein
MHHLQRGPQYISYRIMHLCVWQMQKTQRQGQQFVLQWSAPSSYKQALPQPKLHRIEKFCKGYMWFYLNSLRTPRTSSRSKNEEDLHFSDQCLKCIYLKSLCSWTHVYESKARSSLSLPMNPLLLPFVEDAQKIITLWTTILSLLIKHDHVSLPLSLLHLFQQLTLSYHWGHQWLCIVTWTLGSPLDSHIFGGLVLTVTPMISGWLSWPMGNI